MCVKCKGTGIVYEGTGHQMTGYPFAEKTAAVNCPNGCKGLSLTELLQRRKRNREWRDMCHLRAPVSKCDWHHCTADFGLTARMDRAFARICKASPVLTEEGKLK
ncbi:MAG: hypothetical protein GOVbin4685_40 [Prokaryotic dsDNA virus sp.]|jgi:hypothetical protein|nr:MAG: hypothetical protein GOVbin4685_40 [Prokaryotic dsDNA virus sp.]|tara:strand:+ start:17169 stop:17483 length:315 start_codon:yes stop_codon:yes gene_type:complete